MTRALRRGRLAVLLLAPLAGCALQPHGKTVKRATAVPQPLLVGTITLVNTEQHFVLIDSTNSPGPQPDAALQTRGPDGAEAELKCGAIRRRPFAIADVVKGTPQVGDQVFQQPQ